MITRVRANITHSGGKAPSLFESCRESSSEEFIAISSDWVGVQHDSFSSKQKVGIGDLWSNSFSSGSFVVTTLRKILFSSPIPLRLGRIGREGSLSNTFEATFVCQQKSEFRRLREGTGGFVWSEFRLWLEGLSPRVLDMINIDRSRALSNDLDRYLSATSAR